MFYLKWVYSQIILIYYCVHPALTSSTLIQFDVSLNISSCNSLLYDRSNLKVCLILKISYQLIISYLVQH